MKASNKNQSLTIDSSADCIFKKGNYLNTYIIIDTDGLPNGATLYLVDENKNQLYSPVDINGNYIKSLCSITSGETDAIQLPALYNGNNYSDFDSGTYHWFLKMNTSSTFLETFIPLEVEIRDFKTWELLTPEIYPNEDIKVKIRSYVDTILSASNLPNYLLTSNASYNNGVITYPNGDITNTSIGEHTQIINQSVNYAIDYIVKNPIYCSSPIGDREYTSNLINMSTKIYQDCTLNYTSDMLWQIIINNNEITTRSQWTNEKEKGKKIDGKTLTPNIYDVVFNVQLSDNRTYTCQTSFEVTTDNCSLSLDFISNENNYTLIATYQHMESAIRNTLVGLINVENGNLISTQMTDNNGQAQWTVSTGIYKVVAINKNNEYILDSNILDFIHSYPVVTDVSINNDDDLVVVTTSTIDIGSYKINTDVSANDIGNIIVTSSSLSNINESNNIVTGIEDNNNGGITVNSTTLSNLGNEENILDYVSFDNGYVYGYLTPATYISDIEVVMDVQLNNDENLSITKEKYINIENKDNIISDVDYDNINHSLVVKTVADAKEEFNQ